MVNIESLNLKQKFSALDGAELDTLITKFKNLYNTLLPMFRAQSN